MSEAEQVIEVFYTCFQRRDWKGMLDCYRPDIFFYDPVFQNLEGRQVGAMWEMLLSNAKDLSFSFSNIQMEKGPEGQTSTTSGLSSAETVAAGSSVSYGSCQWEAAYTFSQTGRRVINKGKAWFTFSDGKIAEHMDDWSLWKWSRQALGIPGILFGWTPVLQNKIRRQARKSLDKFMARSASVGPLVGPSTGPSSL